MEYYLVLKGEEILTHAATYMNSEDVMLSEIRQTQKNKYCMIKVTRGIQGSKIQRQKKRMAVVRGWGKGKWGVVSLVQGLSLGK